MKLEGGDGVAEGGVVRVGGGRGQDGDGVEGC